jgi:hypothetical protein
VATLLLGNRAVLDADDLVSLRLVATNLSGTPINSVNVGSDFQIRLFASDLRTNVPVDTKGVFAAYLDVVYDYARATVSSVTYNPNYNNGRRGDPQFPGLIDELGSFQTGTSALGDGEQLVLTVTMRATTAGSFIFRGDPRDNVPLNEVTLFSPPTNVPVDQIRLNEGSLTVNPAGSGGEAEYTNPSNALDVNGDGFVTPIDVLLVINDVNAYGARSLSGGASGEGPANRVYLDVNSDRFVSPIDALLVINYLNSSSKIGAGEGESAGGSADVALLDDTLTAISSDIAVLATDSPNGLASQSDNIGSLGVASPSASVVSSAKQFDAVIAEDRRRDEQREALEALIDGLASDVSESWEA